MQEQQIIHSAQQFSFILMHELLRRVSAIIYGHLQAFRTKLQTEDSHIYIGRNMWQYSRH